MIVLCLQNFDSCAKIILFCQQNPNSGSRISLAGASSSAAAYVAEPSSGQARSGAHPEGDEFQEAKTEGCSSGSEELQTQVPMPRFSQQRKVDDADEDGKETSEYGKIVNLSL